ncbi:hypothetical protein R1T40_01860 [Tritonibacter scottomollicae]|uniref:Uncharacterized protein n=1 Tax=Tritonibacter scottomollicae TaxID=483013 RepID=A0ABZ0HGC4_TRISK|nr:hypothetical protein [Tritonibacter scottomollicae]WOI33522.1 hypothetical protein R1T40_01860 [Tritonibacter scottomollicae]
MILNAAIVLVSALVGAVLMLPRVAGARIWRATVTPLASIIGSGFLVLGPILDTHFGIWAPAVMAALCGVAYAYGAAVRYNIAWLDGTGIRDQLDLRLEQLGSLALAFAYFVSVAYYLNLLGAFAVSLTDLGPEQGRVVTSGVFLLILLVGWTRGFGALERLEEVSVGVKLAIIAGLLFALGWRFVTQATTGALVLHMPDIVGWQAVTLVFGLLVTVQGFEISRYMGAEYDAGTRIRSMRYAQWLSSAIYMLYILFLTFLYLPGQGELSETSIIAFTALVAPILPILLIAAALSAQFSAAVADTGGAGGLVAEVSGGRVPARAVYALLAGAGLTMTWGMSVFEIITYASRAFAFYYALQSMLAARRAYAADDGRRVALFAALSALGIAIMVFGASVE